MADLLGLTSQAALSRRPLAVLAGHSMIGLALFDYEPASIGVVKAKRGVENEARLIYRRLKTDIPLDLPASEEFRVLERKPVWDDAASRRAQTDPRGANQLGTEFRIESLWILGRNVPTAYAHKCKPVPRSRWIIELILRLDLRPSVGNDADDGELPPLREDDRDARRYRVGA